MIKYYNAMVVFEEIPDEIAIAINITNCPCHCKGCHSKFLWEDVGTELTFEELGKLIKKNDGITCVCFMGGDKEPSDINNLARWLKKSQKWKDLKVAWYSGKDEISKEIVINLFDYIKIGHYDEKYGPLNSPTTNQKLYEIGKMGDIVEITDKFWKKKK